MNQLVVRIKTNIENLNGRLDQASRQIQRQKRRGQAGQEAANMVDGLQTEFAEAASDFKRVLQERTDTMKEQTDFSKKVYDYNTDDDDDNPMPNMSLAAAPPVYSSGGGIAGTAPESAFPTLDLTSSLMSPGQSTAGGGLPRPHGIDSYNNIGGGASASMRQRNLQHSYSGSSYGNPASTPLTPLDIQRAEEELGQQMQLIPDQDYLQQRADAMSTVETNIVELGTIFNKLAVMVNEHREMVQRVDDNVQDANTNINLSLNVLTDTLTSLRTNRMLALRVFSVLVLFIIAFIIFFA
jgi:syntaxin 5